MTKIVTIILMIGLFACSEKKQERDFTETGTREHTTPCCKKAEYLGQAVLWYQRSPEMTALYLQSYNLAKRSLEYNILHKKFPKKKSAVIVDIDETILDNSRFEAWLYMNNKEYNKDAWNAWVMDTLATPLPGTIDFLNYAKQKGCEVYYISNRVSDPLFAPTLSNLKKHKLPYADEKHLLLYSDADKTPQGDKTKEYRRLKIEKEYNMEIVLLCGDQLGDFSPAFDVVKAGSETSIKDSLAKYKNEFGNKFIIIPNPMYGEWMNKIILGNDKDTTCAHQDTLRRNKIINWK